MQVEKMFVRVEKADGQGLEEGTIHTVLAAFIQYQTYEDGEVDYDEEVGRIYLIPAPSKARRVTFLRQALLEPSDDETVLYIQPGLVMPDIFFPVRWAYSDEVVEVEPSIITNDSVLHMLKGENDYVR